MTELAVIEGKTQLIPLNGQLVDPRTVLVRYLSDETTKEIAASYGVTRQALGQFLLKHAESEWKEAQVARALARKESAEDDLEAVRAEIQGLQLDQESPNKTAAATQLSLARVRAAEASLKAAQWDLERVCRRIYGADSPANVGQAVQINISLRSVGSAPQPVLSGIASTNTQEDQ
jgi:hypothetical protein